MGITENVIALLGKMVIDKKDDDDGFDNIEVDPEDETDIVRPGDEDDITDYEIESATVNMNR
jgi:hypothetical protein